MTKLPAGQRRSSFPRGILPNLLSLSRIALAPLAVRAILLGQSRQALGIFLAAAITDLLDGLVARRLHCSTRLGACLDPLADKALLSSVYLALGISGAMPWWLVGIIFGRDILILAGAALAFLLTRRREFAPSLWGKLSTWIQVITAATIIVARAWPDSGLERWAGILVWPTAAITIWSGLDYARGAMRHATKQGAR